MNCKYTNRSRTHHISGMYVYYWIANSFPVHCAQEQAVIKAKNVIPSSSNLDPHPTEILEALIQEFEALSNSWKTPFFIKANAKKLKFHLKPHFHDFKIRSRSDIISHFTVAGYHATVHTTAETINLSQLFDMDAHSSLI